ncbi:MAG: SAM-dependent methyltransferase [Acidimicrobiales bacterium]
MGDRPSKATGDDRGPIEINRNVAHAVRIYDYLLGGNDNFAADRAAAEAMAVAYGGLDNAMAYARDNRDYLNRVVHYLVNQAGLRQFLNIGIGIPSPENAYALPQALPQETRVVYVDDDPLVLAHAHSLLRRDREGATDFFEADLREPESILERARATVDLAQPVAIVVTNLHFVGPDDDPYGIIGRLVEGVSPGSHLAMCHLSNDLQTAERTAALQQLSAATRETFSLRSHDEVERFFAGLDLVEPGVVQIARWRPTETGRESADSGVAPFHGGVGQKP